MIEIQLSSKRPRGKDECVDYVKRLGKYIQNNAEFIVGDIHNVRAIQLEYNISADDIPRLIINKEYNLDIYDYCLKDDKRKE